MMTDLITAIKSRVEALLEGATYDNPAGGPPVTPRVYIGGLPAKRSRADQEEDFPCVIIRPVSGSGSRDQEDLTIRLICGAWTGATLDAATPPEQTGCLAAQDLAWRLLQIKRHRGGFAPWRLSLPVTWQVGDDGDQPHPYYFVHIDLLFKGPPLADIE